MLIEIFKTIVSQKFESLTNLKSFFIHINKYFLQLPYAHQHIAVGNSLFPIRDASRLLGRRHGVGNERTVNLQI
jgi:hypothetical protein